VKPTNRFHSNHSQTNEQTNKHTDLILTPRAIFNMLFSHLHFIPHTKNTSQFINSATSVQLIQFPVRSFLSHVFPLTIQQFFTPYLRFCVFLK